MGSKKKSVAAEMADYIIKHNATIRTTAAKFGMGKTAAHKKITALKYTDPRRYAKVRKIFDENFEAKSSRGGLAVWAKYGKLPKSGNNNSDSEAGI